MIHGVPSPRPRRTSAFQTALMAGGVLLGGCTEHQGPWPPPGWTAFELGGPLPGLSPEQVARWEEGQRWFTHIFKAEEGLGPAWNENSCNACHSDPTIGGGMDEPDLHATRQRPDGSCDFLFREGGGNLRRKLSPTMQTLLGTYRELRPAEAEQLGRYLPPPIFGVGMMASIPEEEILAREDPEDSDRDGISGRAARYPDGTVARFLNKADAASLLEIAAKGLWRQLGVTNPFHPEEHPVSGRPVPREADPVPDPEVGEEVVRAIADYMLFLAPPPQVIPASKEDRKAVRRGKALFHEVGCSACHTPVLYTGPSDIPALDRKPVYLFSDLLLHDMGPDLADNCGKDASARELRTRPLWGTRLKIRWLHDGRAPSVRTAVEAHDGEARASRERFQALPPLDQEALLLFLRTL